MHDIPDNVHSEEAFDDLLASSLESEDARHGTESGDADDAEGMLLSSNPPSPLTPLPPWLESDLPNPDAEPLLLPPSSNPPSPLTPLPEWLGCDLPDPDADPLLLPPPVPPPVAAPDAPATRPLTAGAARRASNKKAYDKGKKKAQRCRTASAKNNLNAGGYVPKAATLKKHSAFDKSSANWDAKNLNVAKGGWIGKRKAGSQGRVLGLEELRRMKYRHIAWDGE